MNRIRIALSLALLTLALACQHQRGQVLESSPIMTPSSDFPDVRRPLSDWQQQIVASTRLGTTEVFGFNYYGMGAGWEKRTEVLISKHTAELRTWDSADQSFFFTRKLSVSEVRSLRSNISMNHVDQLASAPYGAWDGVEYGYIHAIGGNAHCFVINNPPEDAGAYSKLIYYFAALESAAPMRLDCRIGTLPNWVEVLVSDPSRFIYDYELRGDKIHLLVGDPYRTDKAWYLWSKAELHWESPEAEPPVAAPNQDQLRALSGTIEIIPGLRFAADQMLLDQTTDAVYALDHGHLFRFPLSKARRMPDTK
jgi:hypothetical protein